MCTELAQIRQLFIKSRFIESCNFELQSYGQQYVGMYLIAKFADVRERYSQTR